VTDVTDYALTEGLTGDDPSSDQEGMRAVTIVLDCRCDVQ